MQGPVVEEAIGGGVSAAAHSSTAVPVVMGVAMLLEAGCRGLDTKKVSEVKSICSQIITLVL